MDPVLLLSVSGLGFNGVLICTNRTKLSLHVLRMKIKHLVTEKIACPACALCVLNKVFQAVAERS